MRPSFKAGALVKTTRSRLISAPVAPAPMARVVSAPSKFDWKVTIAPWRRESEVKVRAEVCPTAAWSAKIVFEPATRLTGPAVSENGVAEALLEKAKVPPRMVIGTGVAPFRDGMR